MTANSFGRKSRMVNVGIGWIGWSDTRVDAANCCKARHTIHYYWFVEFTAIAYWLAQRFKPRGAQFSLHAVIASYERIPPFDAFPPSEDGVSRRVIFCANEKLIE